MLCDLMLCSAAQKLATGKLFDSLIVANVIAVISIGMETFSLRSADNFTIAGAYR